MKVSSKLTRSFLDSTPLGVSLEPAPINSSSSIVISGSTEETIGLGRGDSSSDLGSGNGMDTPKSCRDIDYCESVKILTTWLREMGWKLHWYTSGDSTDAASLSDRTVTISKRQVPRHQYYSLLHECAHVDLLAGPQDTRRGEPYGYLDLFYSQVDERTLRHRVAVVIDEIAAWEHGLILAKRLGLGVDPAKYRDFRNRNLKSYFYWATGQDEDEVQA